MTFFPFTPCPDACQKLWVLSNKGNWLSLIKPFSQLVKNLFIAFLAAKQIVNCATNYCHRWTRGFCLYWVHLARKFPICFFLLYFKSMKSMTKEKWKAASTFDHLHCIYIWHLSSRYSRIHYPTQRLHRYHRMCFDFST